MATQSEGLNGPDGDCEEVVLRMECVDADLLRAHAAALGISPDVLVSRLIARCCSACADQSVRIDDDDF